MSARILVIEDDEMIRSTTFGSFNQPKGMTFHWPKMESSGLRLFKQDPHDLVITDIVMPGQSGIEVLTEIKRKATGNQGLLLSQESTKANEQSFLKYQR